jgi:hypothetical protein
MSSVIKRRALNYLSNAYVWGSQTLNVFIGGLFSDNPWGNSDLTVSACLHIENALHREESKFIRITHDTLNRLFFWEDDHCRNSFLKDYKHARFVMDTALIIEEANNATQRKKVKLP